MPLLSSQRKAQTLSPPLDVHNGYLKQNGITLRRGQFSLVVAAPGVGKSVLANNLAVHSREPVLFFSADSDEWTVRTRTCSILTGVDLNKVAQQLGEEAWDSYFAEQLGRVDHIDWCYMTDIDYEFISLRMAAHGELRGEYPRFIVVDNLSNVIEDNDNEWAELRTICRELQSIARTTKSHVMALHHVVGRREDGTDPVGLSDVNGKVSKLPEQVLGLSRGQQGDLVMSVAKNRGGRSGQRISLPIDYATATVGGFND